MLLRLALPSLMLFACLAEAPDAAPEGFADDDAKGATGLSRDITDTNLVLDLTSHRGTARIDVAAFSGRSLSFEVGELAIESVRVDERDTPFTLAAAQPRGRRLDLRVPSSAQRRQVVIEYTFPDQSELHGFVPSKQTSFTWPAFCQNLFPCHTSPADGTRFGLEVRGLPASATLVAPTRIDSDAPAYMLAFTYGDYSWHELGQTTQGTTVGVYTRPGTERAGLRGAAHLVEAQEWLETHLGPYRFGTRVGSVSANWGPSGFGGMEHHPFWHVADASMSEPETHAHEAAHGWYGNGVRLRCWEDFVLSEGTVTYLETIVTGAIAGQAVEDKLWATLRESLEASVASGDTRAWIRGQGCNRIDLVTHPLWSRAPYDKGAFFYRDLEAQLGRDVVVGVLSAFYNEHAGHAVGMADMLERIHSDTGFDPAPLASKWLTSLGLPD